MYAYLVEVAEEPQDTDNPVVAILKDGVAVEVATWLLEHLRLIWGNHI